MNHSELRAGAEEVKAMSGELRHMAEEMRRQVALSAAMLSALERADALFDAVFELDCGAAGDDEFQAWRADHRRVIAAATGVDRRGAAVCRCGEAIPGEILIDGEWSAVEFCSERCKEMAEFTSDDKRLLRDEFVGNEHESGNGDRWLDEAFEAAWSEGRLPCGNCSNPAEIREELGLLKNIRAISGGEI